MSAKARFRLCLLAATALAGAAIIWFGKEPFHRWQERRLVESARRFLKNGDLRGAYLSSQEALLKNPRSVTACSIAAEVAGTENSPAAILWRQRLAELQPGNSGALIDLAATATRFGESFIAEQALTQVSTAERNIAFRRTAASLAITLKQYAAAEEQFQKALETNPNDESLQLDLATVRLALARPAQMESVRATLNALRAKPQFHLAALRALIGDARASGDSARALLLAGELKQDPQATLGDQLLCLEELQHAGSPEFQTDLSRLQSGATEKPEIAYAVMTWMNAHGLAAQSIQWCESLPAKSRAQLPVPLAEAEARTALADWRQLREIVRDADWGELEFLRLAIHARVLYEMDGQRRRSDFRTLWERATNATRGNPSALVMLGRLVNGWGWKQEATEAWWLAAKNNAGQRAALKALFETYSAEKNTRELYRVARRVLEVEPGNPVAKNNVASLALLLGEDEAEAHRFAAETYKLSPTQPVIASTYALSLHRQKRTAEAVEIMKNLPTVSLADPAIAACYGFLLAENGEHEKARPFLEAADREKERLLPEEAATVAAALRRIP